MAYEESKGVNKKYTSTPSLNPHHHIINLWLKPISITYIN